MKYYINVYYHYHQQGMKEVPYILLITIEMLLGKQHVIKWSI